MAHLVKGYTSIGKGGLHPDVVDLGNYDGLAVCILDGSGNQITSFGGAGGTSEIDNDPAGFTPGSDLGTPAMGLYESSPTTITSGRVGVFGMTADRELKVDITSNSAGVGGGAAYTQDDPVTDPATAPTLLIPRDDTLSTQESLDGDWTTPRANIRGALWVELDPTNAVDASAATIPIQTEVQADFDTDGPPENLSLFGIALPSATGAVVGGTSAYPLRTDPTGTTTQPISGSLTTVSTVTSLTQMNGQAISMGTGVRDAGTQRVTIATDDSVPVTHTALTELATAINTNRLDVNIAADALSLATAANQSTMITSLGSIDTDTGNIAAGFVAEDGALGTGVLVQGDDGLDRHNLQTDTNGYLKTIAQANDGVDIGDVDVASVAAGAGKTILSKTGSASATFTVITAPGAGSIYVTSISYTTVSSTGVTITLKDGAAGTPLRTHILKAPSGAMGGAVENTAAPSYLFKCTATTLLEMSFSAAETVVYNISYFVE